MKEVIIYTDGACSGNPGPGGWGAWLIYGERDLEMCGGERESTNNRMELMGAIEALNRLKEPCRVTLYTDSKYVMEGITKWIHGWKAKGWKRGKNPLKNVELWQALDRATERHTIDWRWVKGHSGEAGNEKADELARMGIQKVMRG